MKKREIQGINESKDFRRHIPSEKLPDFDKAVENMKIILETQEEESFKFYSTINDKSIMNVGFLLWNKIINACHYENENRNYFEYLFNGNPIYGTRKLLCEGIEKLNDGIKEKYSKLIVNYCSSDSA
jgi:hypothetical protein